MMIKEKFNFERIIEVENDINASIAIKSKISRFKSHNIVGNYRQWKGTSPACLYNTHKDNHCVKGFDAMLDLWSNVIKMGHPTMIIVDTNIDRLSQNDPQR